ncbi:MAG: DUF2497 domain-containing protein [Hyphomicrobiales bacterium]|nr:DUF2497 domain-containing protein [Hyphomicrobiales bacterium]
MEEILASIRRIIADDKIGSEVAKTPAPAEPMVEPVAETAIPAEPEASFELRDVAAEPMLHEVVHVAAPEPEPAPAPAPEPEPMASAASVPPVDDLADVIDLADHPEVVATRLVTDFRAASPPPPPFPMIDGAETAPAEPLASPFTDAAVASSFDALAKSVMLDNKPLIEQLTRDMLRPMLKSWLDDNLPVMVEKLVRAEIERVARGGR